MHNLSESTEITDKTIPITFTVLIYAGNVKTEREKL